MNIKTKLIKEQLLGENTKIELLVSKYPSYTSLKVVISHKNENDKEPEEIGHAFVDVHFKSAEWIDFVITEPCNRDKGIGSKTVKFVIAHLKTIGVREIWGEISSVDNIERAINFWKKNGFSVDRYAPNAEAMYVAKIMLSLNE